MKTYINIAIISMIAMFSHAQPSQDMKIKLPGCVTKGVLSNRLRYYLVKDDYPANCVEIRLIMNVGSVQQDKGQQGIAHFIEHLAFDGTKNFSKRSMIEYWESLGMKFGRDINAFTTHDRTQYILSLPVDSPDDPSIAKSLTALYGWLCGMECNDDMIEKERRIITEELRGYNVDDDFYALKMGDNRFSHNFPLGTSEQIKSITRKKLLDFYNKWYNPSNATIIVAGDINTDKVKDCIVKTFSSIKMGRKSKDKKYELTYNKGFNIHEICDTIRKNSSLELLIPHKYVPMTNINETYLRRMQLMLVEAIEKRLMARNIKAKFNDSWYLASTNHFSVEMEGNNEEYFLSSVKSIASELNYMANSGWCDEEMRQIKESAIKKCKHIDHTSISSAEWCDNITDIVTVGDCSIYDSKEADALKKLVINTTTRQLQDILKEWLNNAKETMLLAFRNANEARCHLNADNIKQAWLSGLKTTPEPFTYKTKETNTEENKHKTSTPECLLAAPAFNTSNIATEQFLQNIGATLIKLNNGLDIVLRPTPDDSRQLLFQLIGRGGNGDLPDSLAHAFSGADGIIEMGGIANVNRDSLSSYLYENEMSIICATGNYWHEIIGMAPSDKSMPFFNYIKEKIYRPERCKEEYDDYIAEMSETDGNKTYLGKLMDSDISRQMTNRLDSLVGNSIIRNDDNTHDKQKQYGIDDIIDYFVSLYSNPRETTLILTGDYDIETVKKNVVAAFSSLSTPQRETAICRKPFIIPHKIIDEPFQAMNDSITTFSWVMPFNYTPSLSNSLELKLMRDILQNRAISKLREQSGLAYSPFVGISYNGVPQQSCYFDLSSSIMPKNAERMRDEVLGIIDSLQHTTVSQNELNGLKRSFQVTKRQTLSAVAGAAWRSTLASLIKNGESIIDFNDYDAILNRITPEILQSRFQEYLDKNSYILLHSGKFIEK